MRAKIEKRDVPVPADAPAIPRQVDSLSQFDATVSVLQEYLKVGWGEGTRTHCAVQCLK